MVQSGRVSGSATPGVDRDRGCAIDSETRRDSDRRTSAARTACAAAMSPAVVGCQDRRDLRGARRRPLRGRHGRDSELAA
jgi:hypothetical protein